MNSGKLARCLSLLLATCDESCDCFYILSQFGAPNSCLSDQMAGEDIGSRMFARTLLGSEGDICLKNADFLA